MRSCYLHLLLLLRLLLLSLQYWLLLTACYRMNTFLLGYSKCTDRLPPLFPLLCKNELKVEARTIPKKCYEPRSSNASLRVCVVALVPPPAPPPLKCQRLTCCVLEGKSRPFLWVNTSTACHGFVVENLVCWSLGHVHVHWRWQGRQGANRNYGKPAVGHK